MKPCPVKRVAYRCGIWNGALDYLVNFANEQKEKYTACATNAKTKEELERDKNMNSDISNDKKETPDFDSATAYFNEMYDAIKDGWKVNNMKMNNDSKNTENKDSVTNTIIKKPYISVLKDGLKALNIDKISFDEFVNLVYTIHRIYSED
jgi:hypothetical protein